jgi:hypothetical protein
VLVFGARFVVQRLLYNADQTGWLAAARIGMGWPLTALAGLVTYAAIKTAQRAMAGAGDVFGPVVVPIDADTVGD